MRRHSIALVMAATLLAAAPLAQSPSLQTPEAAFGHRMGADRELADWPALQRYFETIAAASDRVELVDAGPTTEGRRLIAAIVSSPENITRLEEIRARAPGTLVIGPATSSRADSRTARLFSQLGESFADGREVAEFVDAISFHANALDDETVSEVEGEVGEQLRVWTVPVDWTR